MDRVRTFWKAFLTVSQMRWCWLILGSYVIAYAILRLTHSFGGWAAGICAIVLLGWMLAVYVSTFVLYRRARAEEEFTASPWARADGSHHYDE